MNDLSKNALLVAIGVVVVAAMMGAIFSQGSAVQILGFATFIVVQLLGQLQQAKANDAIAEKAEEVKVALEKTNVNTGKKIDDLTVLAEDTKQTGDAVHILVNSSMSAQLKISMLALKRVAEITKHADDIAAAELAEKLFHEHEKKQAQVDAKDGKPPAGAKHPEGKATTQKEAVVKAVKEIQQASKVAVESIEQAATDSPMRVIITPDEKNPPSVIVVEKKEDKP